MIFVTCADKPGAPENLQASDIHADHCKLSWQPPSDDGGADISGHYEHIYYANNGKRLTENI